MQQSSMLVEQLNEALRNKLQASGCVTGRLECRITPVFLLNLQGQRNNGQSLFFWELERNINMLLDRYQTTEAAHAAAIVIDIDLARNSFVYNIISQEQAAAQREREANAQKDEETRRLLQLKQNLLSRNTPFGRQLAEQVSYALERGALCYSHRDYCGMGLEKNAQGNYVYAAVWDGWLQPLQTFTSREAFIQWLAVQSDASLSRVNEPDTWVWDNQVINRQRLEDFVNWNQGFDPIHHR
ncbi:hypothetical protein F0L74_07140 [Chitinophaga agrisoli]|uniref:Uncharacterized protein n=1 Tax=Chitinophaga agrisoli TaxID=2607653 RepID=A0A5B2W674_9BACT|nr:hypothetical protein [Chitinophaga agrisoli]KAA2245719.1 hypothetical protein F0L74_07140 [Chitinophaga agrisoli]